MDCPACDRATRVLESRRADDGAAVRRRRECTACGHRFTTFERREREPAYVAQARRRAPALRPHEAARGAAARGPQAPGRRRRRRGARRPGRVGRSRPAAASSAPSGSASSASRASRDLDRGAYLQFAGTLPSERGVCGVGAGGFRPGRARECIVPRQSGMKRLQGQSKRSRDGQSAARRRELSQGGLAVERRLHDPRRPPLRRGRVGASRRRDRRPREPRLRAARGRVPGDLVAERDQHRRPEVLPRPARLPRARELGQADDLPRRRARSPAGAARAATSPPTRTPTPSRPS